MLAPGLLERTCMISYYYYYYFKFNSHRQQIFSEFFVE